MYDALGNLAAIRMINGSTTTNYYVRTKLNGDVEQIYDTSGNLLARYIYDTWGNTVSIKNASGAEITDANHIANRNAIRYRGYYWDSETGFYYLQSRYYDPEIGRYINADGYVFTGQDMQSGNMYAYCGNGPVIRNDPYGNMHETIDGDSFRTQEEIQKELKKWQRYFQIKRDIANFDIQNEDPHKAIDAYYFSGYKGPFVIKHNSERLTSWAICGIVFLNNNEYTTSNTLKHEYGHTLQEQEMGLGKYLFAVAIPSVSYFFLSGNNEVMLKNYYNMPWEYDADMRGNVDRSHAKWAAFVSDLYFLLME